MSEVKYDSMKSSLKRVFGGISENNKDVAVKDEPIFYDQCYNTSTQETFYNTSGRGQWRGKGRNMARPGNYRGRGGYQRGNSGFNGGYQSEKYGKRRNPTDKEGNIMRCLICESIYHFARFCPHSHENFDENTGSNKGNTNKGNNQSDINSETVQLSLLVAFTEGDNKTEKLGNLVKESSCSAILDCGASSSVCGEVWFNDYLQSLSEYERNNIVEKKSNTNFTFGSGTTYQSLKCVQLPCCINGMKANIEVDVVKCNVPLLLSKKAMKKGKMIINFHEDTIQVGGKIAKLQETGSGHYKLPLRF